LYCIASRRSQAAQTRYLSASSVDHLSGFVAVPVVWLESDDARCRDQYSASILITGILSFLLICLARLTGFGNEDMMFLMQHSHIPIATAQHRMAVI